MNQGGMRQGNARIIVFCIWIEYFSFPDCQK